MILPPTLRLGTSSWSEKSWNGVFYPAGLPARDQLAHYARSYRAVEADVTYYRVPSPAMVRGWRDRTPADFLLAAKFPASIVHGGEGKTPDPGRVLDPEATRKDTGAFLGAMAELGPKCGPLLLQFPYFNRSVFASAEAFLPRLDAYLEALPPGHRYAVEVRNRSWIAEPLLDLLRRRACALAWVDLAYLPHPADLAAERDILTTDFIYGRLIGDRQAVEARTATFDRIVLDQSARLRRWAGLLAAVLPRATLALVFANNHYAGYAPGTLAELEAALRAV
jgi:uncharacterized protein YecE (DUF72 family)